MSSMIRGGLAMATLAIAAASLSFAAVSWARGVPTRHVRLIKVSSKRFEFVPDHLVVKRGEAVDIELSALDAVMGFSLPDLAVRATMVPGSVTHLRFTPEKAGTFTFLCDVFCGIGHEDMNGTITVVD